MFESTGLFDLQNPHLIGKLINAPDNIKKITKVIAPHNQEMLIISSKDFPKNSIEINEASVPILAFSSIYSENQPLLAVFGPSEDSVEIYSKSIQIMGIQSDKDTSETISNYKYSYTSPSFSKDEKNKEPKKTKTLKTTFKFDKFSKTLPCMHRVFAVNHEGVLHVRLSSQWPFHVKTAICNALGLKAENIKLYIEQPDTEEDQLLFSPSFSAVIAVVAAIKSGQLVELDVPLKSVHPQMEFTTETSVDSNGIPIRQKTDVVVQLGAFPYFIEEYARNIICGCTPVYKLQKLEINIKLKKTFNECSIFFGDLGYSTSLAAMEMHYSSIAHYLNIFSSDFKKNNCGAEYPRVRTSDTKTHLPHIIDMTIEDSKYTRKEFIYKQKNTSDEISKLLNYKRGIGFACGEGIQGFSNSEKRLNSFVTQLEYKENGNVCIDRDTALKNKMRNYIEDLVANELEINKDQIVFSDMSSSDTDIGPYTLSRGICFYPVTVKIACRELLKALIDGKKKPLKVRVKNTTTSKAFFNSHSSGCVVVELFLDPIACVPRVSKIWINLYLGKIYNERDFENNVRRTVNSVLSTFFPCIIENPKTEVHYVSDKSIETGSVTSLVKALVIAACSDAVSQLINRRIIKLPLSSEEIIKYLDFDKKYNGEKK